jgi:hypothetical protein
VKLALVAVLAAAAAGCGDSNAELVDAAPFVKPDSAPPEQRPPVLTSFVASPSQVSAGFATDITWNWTYGGLPFPDPTCTIDNGVGAVTRGAMRSVTLAQVTTFTLTCTNGAGMASRQVVVSVPSSAPSILTLTATPMVTQIGQATPVTWAWTYASTPSPAYGCSISPTVGAVTNGQTLPLTQSTGTTYTLTCMNAAGQRQRTVFVGAATTPAIATFTATPSTVTANTPTTVTFAWTYSNAPTPTPTCSIDQGIGTITSGSARSVTLAASTAYTLTCTNTGGAAMQSTTITVQ